MNSLKLVSLKIDDVCLIFKEGLNYIVGKNSSGKTTIFNCIKYALGLNKSSIENSIHSVCLNLCINEIEFNFSRNIVDTYVVITFDNIVHRFRPMSNDLNEFLNSHFQPDYIFGRDYETIFTLLDFCFLSEEHSVSRRHKWEAISSICGVNVSLLSSVEKDINLLNKKVSKNKETQKLLEEFSELILIKLDENIQKTYFNENINLTKAEFLSGFRADEELLNNAIYKFDDIKKKSEYELRERVAEIEKIFISLSGFSDYKLWGFLGLESFVKEKNNYISYGEEIFYNFILVLAIAKVSQYSNYNFPNIIINDSYLSSEIDEESYRKVLEILEDVVGKEKGLQYIEFTHREDVPKEHVVLNLNAQGAFHAFRR